MSQHRNLVLALGGTCLLVVVFVAAPIFVAWRWLGPAKGAFALAALAYVHLSLGLLEKELRSQVARLRAETAQRRAAAAPVDKDLH